MHLAMLSNIFQQPLSSVRLDFEMAAAEPVENFTTNALGTVLGYIGAEAATDAIFKRLLWPQGSYSDFNIKNSFKMALLLPSGGPLYKAALQTLDNM